MPSEEIDGQVRSTVRREFWQTAEGRVQTEKEIEVLGRQPERRVDNLGAGLAVPVGIGERELSRIVEGIANFQDGKGLILPKLLEFPVLPELDGGEFQRAERRLDEIQAGIGGCRVLLLARSGGHAVVRV